MATDHNFRIKNGLDVQGANATIVSDGGDTRITSSGEFRFRPEGTTTNRVRLTLNTVHITGSLDASANVDGNAFRIDGTTVIDSSRRVYVTNIQNSGAISFLNGSAGTSGSGAQGISVRDLYAGTTYANRTAAAGTIDALNGFKVAGTTVISSARLLENVTLDNGTAGARRVVDAWHYDSGNTKRFYFGNASNTYFGTGTGYVFRNSSDAGKFTISSTGGINIAGGDTQVTGTTAIAYNGTVILDTSRNLTVVGITGTGSYHEIGNNTGAVSNDGSWNARLNISGTSHARLDLFEDGDNSKLRAYVHAGYNAHFGTATNTSLEIETNGSTRFRADSSGLNIETGHSIRHNGTTVLDSSRNLTNIGTITASGSVTLSSNSTSVNTRSLLARDTNGLNIGTTNATTAISINNSANVSMPYALSVTGTITSGGNVNTTSGAFQINGTTVINSSRQLRSINSIYNASDVQVMDLSNATYTILKDPDGGVRVYLGDVGDAGNYYDNSAHTFRNRSANLQVQISDGGVNLSNTSATYKVQGTTVIDANRNISAGTISSGAIDVTVNGDKRIVLNQTGASQNSGLQFKYAGTRTWDIYNSGTSTTPLYFYSQVAGDNVMTLTTGGNVGIGTTSPSQKLDVNGGAEFNGETYIRSTSNVGLRIQTTDQGTSSSDGLRVGLNASHAFVWNLENKDLALATNNTERLTVQAAGAIRFNQAYSFPTSDGSANQVLQTNGSGQLSFATVTSGGGAVDSIANFANNRVITASDSDSLNGEANLTFDGTLLKFTTNNHTLTTHNQYNIELRSGTTGAMGVLGRNSNSDFRFQLYGDGSYYGFLDGAWNSWDIKKTINGQLQVDEGSGLNKVWTAGNDGSGSGLDADLLKGRTWNENMGVSTQHNITVDGDSDKYYPVVITGLNHESGTEVHIERGYAETGPNDWNNSTHKGGLSLRFSIAGASGWGGYPTHINVEEFGEIYSRILGGIKFTAHTMRAVVWLRGGTAVYRIFTQKDTSITIYDDTSSGYTNGSGWLVYDHSNSSYDVYENYRTQAQADTGAQNEVIAKMPVRAGGTTKANQVNYAAGGSTLNGGNLFWNDANDGSGSGLDADLLDGVNSASFMRSDTADSFTALPTFANGATGTLASRTGFFDFLGYNTSYGSYIGGGISNAGSKYLYAGGFMNDNGTVGTLWRSTNDGSGSGLDADLLDGVQASSFVRTDASSTVGNVNISFTGTPSSSNIIRFDNGSGQSMNSASSYLSRLEIRQATANADAFMSFHIAGDYAAYFGLDGATNDFSVGGWSMGANKYRVWHAGNDGSGSGLDADKLDGQEGSYYARKTYWPDATTQLGASTHGLTNLNTEALWSKPAGYQTFVRASNSNGLPSNHGQSYFGYTVTSKRDTGGGYSALLTSYDNSNMYFTYRSANTAYPTWRKLWHDGNDGSGSGLDADTLDGNQASAFLTSVPNHSANLITSGTIASARLPSPLDSSHAHAVTGSAFATTGSPGSVLEYQQASSITDTKLAPGGDWYNTIRMGHGNPYSYYSNTMAVKMTGTNVGQLYIQCISNNSAQGWRQVWDSSSDGSGSGLDADTVDGVQLANIARTDIAETFTNNVTVNNNLYIGDGDDGYFYNDQNGRTAFANGDFYIQNSVGNYYNYATNQYIGDSSGDNIYFRGNVLSGTGWGINGAGKLTTRDHQISAGYHLQRSDHHSGHLEGSYNNIGGNGNKSNPIYTIGSSYNPTDAALSNMYGIGYTSHSASFLNFTGGSNWGLYVAADGDARVWLDGSNGVISSTGQHYVGSNVVWNAGNDGSGSGLDADLLDGLDLHTGRNNEANKVVRTNGSGYIDAGWINTTSGARTTQAITRVYASDDAYIRYYTLANFGDQLASHINYNSLENKPTIPTNNNQLTNGAGYITSFTETNAFIGDGGSGSTHPGTSRAIYTGQLSAGGNVLGMPTVNNANAFLTLNKHSGEYNSQLGFSSNGNIYYRNFSNTAINSTQAWRTIWDSGNDGSGSGLDADLLDGQHGSYYRNASNLNAGTVPTGQMPKILPTSGNYQWSASTAASGYSPVGISTSFVRSNEGWPNYGTVLHVGGRGGSDAGGDFQLFSGHGSGNGGNYLRVRNADNSANPTDSWTAFRTIWDSGNDGSGSGLDADNLDGYAWTSQNKAVAWRNGTTEAGNGQGITFWGGTGTAGSNAYAIFMGTSGTYGRVPGETTSDYNMYFKMTSGTNRGFVFRNNTTNVAGFDASGHLSCGNVLIRDENALIFDRDSATGDPSTKIYADDYPDAGYNSAASKYWVALESKGGTHIILNTDGATNSGENSYDHFTIFQDQATHAGRQFYVTNIGNVHAKGDITAFQSSNMSDVRLKKNIKPLENSLQKIQQLEGVSFDWKDEDRGSSIGFIAQDFEKVVPELVQEKPCINDGTTMHKSINYGNLVGLLVEGMKEQQEQIEKLKQQVQNLTDQK